MPTNPPSFSAPQQALGYMFQPRYALYSLLMMPEETTCLLEGDDDIDFSDPEEGKLLASLKHKAPGDTLTDLSPDFWKSVRIWAAYFKKHRTEIATTSFFLITTGKVQISSFLAKFLINSDKNSNIEEIVETAISTLESSNSKLLSKIRSELLQFSIEDLQSIFSRITIFDCQDRIDSIPQKIQDRMRTVRPKFRQPVFERLEGWWNDQCVNVMTGKRSEPIRGSELSEMLAHISEQFRDDNLPLDFFDAEPEEGVDPEGDNRMFVTQLRDIGLKSNRIRRAILDYYRAFEQRSAWARENITLTGEVEKYDVRLVDEWLRVKEIACDELEDGCSEDAVSQAGSRIFTELSSSLNPNLRIRPQVTAPYVTIGSYHMLANESAPKVHWHPQFLERLKAILEEKEK